MEGDSWCPRSPAVCRDGAGLLSACCALLGAGVVPAANMGGELQHGWMDTLRVLWGGCWVPSCSLPRLKSGPSGKAEGVSCHNTLATCAGLGDGWHCRSALPAPCETRQPHIAASHAVLPPAPGRISNRTRLFVLSDIKPHAEY